MEKAMDASEVAWLLERDNPAVRARALVDLLEKPESAPEVVEARAHVMRSGVVPRILAKQAPGGYWGKAEDFYVRAKYKGTVWQLVVLAELGADGQDSRVRCACEFVLEHAQDRESGGFAYASGPGRGGDHKKVLPCLTGNMVWSLMRLGLAADPRVQRGVEWIASYQRFDDGVARAPRGWPYEGRENCWGKHTCHLGVVKALKALGAIPVEARSGDVRATIERGAEYLLRHHLFKRSHDVGEVAQSRWLELGFPLMWDTDALEMLEVLSELGYRHERMQEAVDLVASKRDADGRWRMERSFNGRMLTNIERRHRPSKWISLRALSVLKRLERWPEDAGARGCA